MRDRIDALREYFPDVKSEDWGTRDCRPRSASHQGGQGEKEGVLEFGTEVVAASDGSLAALLGPPLKSVYFRSYHVRSVSRLL